MRGRNLSLALSIHSDGRLRAHSWRFDAVQCRRSSRVSARIRAIFIERALSNRRGHEKVSVARKPTLRRHTRLVIDKDTRSRSLTRFHARIYNCTNKLLIETSKARQIYTDQKLLQEILKVTCPILFSDPLRNIVHPNIAHSWSLRNCVIKKRKMENPIFASLITFAWW